MKFILALPVMLLLSGCLSFPTQTVYKWKEACLEMPEYTKSQQEEMMKEIDSSAGKYPMWEKFTTDSVNLRLDNRKACSNAQATKSPILDSKE